MDWMAIIIAFIGSGILSTLINFWFEEKRHAREIANQKNMKGFQDKLAIYRMIVDLISDFLNDFNLHLIDGTQIPQEKIYYFNSMRMRTFGYLCIYADQKAIDAHEELIEYIYGVLEGNIEGEWPEVRNRALSLLNGFRSSYDPQLPPAMYNGNR